MSAIERAVTHEPVKPRFWPRLEPFFETKVFKAFQSVASPLGNNRVWGWGRGGGEGGWFTIESFYTRDCILGLTIYGLKV